VLRAVGSVEELPAASPPADDEPAEFPVWQAVALGALHGPA